VVHKPDSTRVNDWLQLGSDGTYEWQQEGIKSTGTWKLNSSGKVITFTDAKSKKSLNYNLKGVTTTELIIEFQTPDLVRTKYHYQAIKE
jgi:hypothetical protein